jgi:hypothetical protein
MAAEYVPNRSDTIWISLNHVTREVLLKPKTLTQILKI